MQVVSLRFLYKVPDDGKAVSAGFLIVEPEKINQRAAHLASGNNFIDKAV